MLLATTSISVGFLWWRWWAEKRQKQKASRRLQQDIEGRRRAEAALRLRSSETPYLSGHELQALCNISGLLARPGSFEDQAAPSRRVGMARVADAEERVREISRLATIGELAAGVAHEINNPLTGILGYCGLLMAEDLSDSARADLQTVRSEAQRAADVVHNLLSLARRSGPAKTSLDLTSVLVRALELLKAFTFQTDNITVIRDFSKGLPRTAANEQQVLQVFLNILTNAEQAMRAAHQGGRLTIQTGSSGRQIKIDIGDNGPGIAPEHLAMVFDPFFTTKGSGERTGLGLSISTAWFGSMAATFGWRASLEKGQRSTSNSPWWARCPKQLPRLARSRLRDLCRRKVADLFIIVSDESRAFGGSGEGLTPAPPA